jgi:dolichol-phosphate mannosyltransferase
LLIVDDNSPDGTGRAADELAKNHPDQVAVLHRQHKEGLGKAYIHGLTEAIQAGADYILQMDADYSHSPRYIPDMIRLIADNDLVIGSRYVSGGSLDERWGVDRRLLSWWANSVWVRLLLGLRTKDATGGFRCWRASALRCIGLENIRSNGYDFMVEMTFMAEKCKLRIRETPIHFQERDSGASKMSLRVKLEAALRVLEIRRRH